MKEACENLDEDIVQINNLYTLLLKEVSKKITKKSYAELYNIDYLKDLEKKSEEFEKQIKKLNLPVTIINPNYWRIEGMKKIYDVFYRNVTEEYGRDLSEYMPKEEESVDEEEIDEDWDFDIIDNKKETKEEKKAVKPKKIKRKIKGISQEEEKSNSEIDDDEIDMILGFNGENNAPEDFDDEEIAPEDDFREDEEEDDVYYDIWGNDIKDEDDAEEDDEDDFDDEEDFDDNEEEETEKDDDESDDWDDQDDDDSDWEDDEEDTDDEDWDDEIEEDDEYDEEDWDDEFEEDGDEEELEEPKTKNKKNDDWGNEFIKINEKDKTKKKKGFFDKFKK